MTNKFNIKKLSKRDKLVVLLYISKIANILLKFLIIVIITRKLNDTNLFGKYSYYLTLGNYVALFIGFGFLAATSRLIAVAKNHLQEVKIYGTIYIINLLFSTMFIIIMILISILYLQDYNSIIILAILSQSILLNRLLIRIQVSSNRIMSHITTESVINIILFIIFLIFDLQYQGYLIIYYSIYFIINNFVFFVFFKPKFQGIKETIKLLMIDVKKYGFSMYLGRIASVGTYDLDKIMLENIVGVESVGFYNLGLTFSAPLTTFSQSLTSVFFKDMSKAKIIPKKIFVYNTIWLLVSSLLLALIGKPIFLYVFGEDYSITANLLPLFALLAFLNGFYIPFNDYFNARGHGKELRNRAFILTGANIILNFTFIPIFGLIGAVYATIIALFVNNLAFIYYYRKIIKSDKYYLD